MRHSNPEKNEKSYPEKGIFRPFLGKDSPHRTDKTDRTCTPQKPAATSHSYAFVKPRILCTAAAIDAAVAKAVAATVAAAAATAAAATGRASTPTCTKDTKKPFLKLLLFYFQEKNEKQ